jgi:hypothetical protein
MPICQPGVDGVVLRDPDALGRLGPGFEAELVQVGSELHLELDELGVGTEGGLFRDRSGDELRRLPPLFKDARDHRVTTGLVGQISQEVTVVPAGHADLAEAELLGLSRTISVRRTEPSSGRGAPGRSLADALAAAIARISRGPAGSTACHRHCSAHTTASP